MRLPAIGLTLPWQLVAAHDPGPMYLTGSFSCPANAPGAENCRLIMNRSRNEFFVLRIRSCRRNLFAYIVCVAGKSTDCVAFFATRREKQTGRYGDLGLRSVVCRRFNNPTRAAHSTKPARRFVRETERRDLRRPSGHPAALRLSDRKSTRLNSSHPSISYAVFCLKKKNNIARTWRW